MKVRNIAIIAHVDHGKTTLVDQLLKQAGTFRANEEAPDRVMDSNELEKERGITILAKTTAIQYRGYKINLLDTPGHADFGGEVERIMRLVDGVLLVVDAFEGTMPQTRFVLKKALEAKVKPIVVVNKVDRPHADPEKAADEALELFMELGAPEELLDFPIVYCSALKGTSSFSPKLEDQKPTMEPIFETIIDYVPEPKADPNGPFQFQAALLDYNDYVGRIGIGLVSRGQVRVGDQATAIRNDKSTINFRIQKIFGYEGLKKIELKSAVAGDICAIAGLEDISVGETICDPNNLSPLPPIRIDEPTLRMTFYVNDSPFAGQEGKFLTARHIDDRLYKETQRDVSLKVKRVENSDSWIVSGRGELHLGVLIENMRREGFELQVSKPEVIVKEINGTKCEPYEDLSLDLPLIYQGPVMEALGERGAELVDIENRENQVKMTYIIPSRGLMGFMTEYLTLTRGYGIISHAYREYRPIAGQSVGRRLVGVMVATDPGTSTHYAIQQLEPRGRLFIAPGEKVYEGMIVGENAYDTDLTCNVCRLKNLSNQRSVGKDPTVVLKRPIRLSLEAALDYINPDELVEITPLSFRMRKKILNTVERKKYEAHHPLTK